ncbi:unnamed protein product [Symbiodinium natans]|uniref:Uncharacterized protein n=1 Tax=Symbiodinium natans TaxID=878477 RepID=A0A812LBB9_9DINO|nr:unnamed protein product [Symbiodinium natans]
MSLALHFARREHRNPHKPKPPSLPGLCECQSRRPKASQVLPEELVSEDVWDAPGSSNSITLRSVGLIVAVLTLMGKTSQHSTKHPMQQVDVEVAMLCPYHQTGDV